MTLDKIIDISKMLADYLEDGVYEGNNDFIYFKKYNTVWVVPLDPDRISNIITLEKPVDFDYCQIDDYKDFFWKVKNSDRCNEIYNAIPDTKKKVLKIKVSELFD